MGKLEELAMMLGVFTAGIISQLGTTPEEAQRIADDIIGSYSDHFEAKEKIENAKRLSQNQVTIKGYTFKL
jgi:hypothetical protein